MRQRRYTDQELAEAVQQETSVAMVLKRLKLKPAGGNYAGIQKRVRLLCLNTNHWLGQGHRKGSVIPVYTTPLQELLVLDRETSSVNLRKRLIREKIFENRCALCGIFSWQDLPLVLHLDHINGIRSDNRLDNLRLLCPNCHSQTETYCGRNIGKNIGKERTI